METDKLFMSTTEKTFQYDNILPHLPVPLLNKTLQKYLDSVRPFITSDEYVRTEKIVKSFEKGVGATLHAKLQARAQQMPNWLETWWEQYAYLMQRSPLIPTSNIGAPYPTSEPMWAPHAMEQIPRAALFLHYNLQYWIMLRRQQLKPDKPRGQIWSMNQYRKMFGTFRIPGEVFDRIQMNFTTDQEGLPKSNYVMVLCRGHIFKMEVLDSKYEPLTAPELEGKIRYIYDECQQNPFGQNVAALTCDDRTRWAKNREQLMNCHPENKKHLEEIENALKFICLDERCPATESELLMEAIGGDVCNRWGDTFTSIIYKNGTVTAGGDHTPCDGMVGISLSLYLMMKFQECDGTWQGNQEIRQTPMPVELRFHLDNYFNAAIDIAISTSTALINNMIWRRMIYPKFGSKFITSLKIKPDTLVQIVLQLAYYSLHNRPAPTYETASTRCFYNGRTETVRSCTSEAIQWAKSMLDPLQSNAKQMQLFKHAVNKHDILMEEGKRNEGCDRHLLGLYILSMESGMPTPEIFTDPAWVRSGGNGNFILSTSFAGYTPIVGGATAMCLDGYGVFYSITSDKIYFSLTAWKSSKVTNLDSFQRCLQTSLHSLHKLLIKSSL